MANCGGEAGEEGIEGLEKLVVNLAYSYVGYGKGVVNKLLKDSAKTPTADPLRAELLGATETHTAPSEGRDGGPEDHRWPPDFRGPDGVSPPVVGRQASKSPGGPRSGVHQP